MSTSPIPAWIQILAALLTPVVALMAVYFARQQWLTARDKLKIDLFEKRWAIYTATMDFAVEACQAHKTMNVPELNQLSTHALEASFLLNRAISERLFEMSQRARSMRDGNLSPEAQAEERRWFEAQSRELPTLFVQFLKIRT